MTDGTVAYSDDEEALPAKPSRSGIIMGALLGLGGLFGLAYFIATFQYMEDSVPQQGAKGKHLRVPTKSLRFAAGVAGPINYATNEGIYLTRQGSGWLALEQTCPHQGCPVAWQVDQARFVCPCHGSEYDRLGNVVQGPSARGLYHHLVQVEPDALVIEGRA
jgi:Rieske Fe-S protein